MNITVKCLRPVASTYYVNLKEIGVNPYGCRYTKWNSMETGNLNFNNATTSGSVHYNVTLLP